MRSTPPRSSRSSKGPPSLHKRSSCSISTQTGRSPVLYHLHVLTRKCVDQNQIQRSFYLPFRPADPLLQYAKTGFLPKEQRQVSAAAIDSLTQYAPNMSLNVIISSNGVSAQGHSSVRRMISAQSAEFCR